MPIELFALCFAGLVLAAAICDIATMEIPNRISIALIALFPIAAWSAGLNWQDIAWCLGLGVAAFGVVFALFHLGVMGGGDAKMIAAIAPWLGFSGLTPFLLYMSIAGALLAAMAIFARRTVGANGEHPAFLRRLLDPERGIPYAVAIAAGALGAAPKAAVFIGQFG
jgi:prepilin peptidase CpaA